MRILLFFLLINSDLLANKPEWIPDYFVSYEQDKNPDKLGARIRVICEFDADYDPFRELRFGMNGSNERIKLSDKNIAEVIRKPQKAVFQFYYDSHFQEIETDSIDIKTGQITIISLHFKAKNDQRPVKKPVIYLYPESDLEISVDLETTGELTFTYPDYSKNWKGIAHPDGSVSIAGKTYPYLFWEAEQRFNTFDFERGGFVLSRETVVSLLEKQLYELGFNDKEKTDFITFWGPQLQKHERVYVQFILNEGCDLFARLNIEPKPDHLNRVYMVWTPVDNHRNVFIKPQKLEKMNRDDFDVLEWGGIELANPTN
ncbi:hypothetical protein [Fluviicola sp.]|uniref:hypothetical protein n=1 Tax=Fluviicola sp. TaxID=1917219 RepID=UPI0031D2396F